jgi:hypothetical protein
MTPGEFKFPTDMYVVEEKDGEDSYTLNYDSLKELDLTEGQPRTVAVYVLKETVKVTKKTSFDIKREKAK